MAMLYKRDIEPYCDTTFILLYVKFNELLQGFWTQNLLLLLLLLLQAPCVASEKVTSY